ncbi:MAG: patatin-like phospholipase family protein, partial [Pseudomonadota bacterium]
MTPLPVTDKPLVFRAGPRARQTLLDRGLQPDDVGAVTAAAGGPKFLGI